MHFSAMNIIKTDRRNCLGEDHLDDLMHIAIDGQPLSQWDATIAMEGQAATLCFRPQNST